MTSTGCTRPICRPGAWREPPETAAARLGAKLQDLAVTLESAIGSAQEQRETLAAETAELSVNGALTLQDVLGAIDRLTQSTKESQVRYALLEARIDAVTREIGALQQQLAAVAQECRADPTTALPTRATFEATLTKALGGRRRDAPADVGHAVQPRLLHGVQRELRHLSGRPGAALDRAAVQGAHASRRHGRALRRRRVRRDPAADAGARGGRLRGTLPPDADGAADGAARQRRRACHGLDRRRRRDQGRHAGIPAAPRRTTA